MLHVKTDSVCVHHWVSDTLIGRTQVRNKAATEMLIRRRLNTLKSLLGSMSWMWTWYWFRQIRTWPTDWRGCLRGGSPLWRWRMDLSHWSELFMDELNADQIMAIHRSSGHPGVRRTTYFVRRICPATPRAAVKMAIRTCEECQSIDPAPVHWEKGKLEVDDNWQRG